jgi:predicted phosphohydrolase
MARKLRIVAVSDTHNCHREIDIPDGDILVHAGDISIEGNVEDLRDFNDFLGELPHRHKIVVCGNHDFCFERQPAEARAAITNAIYLQDSGVEVEGLKFYGSPWQPWFYDWAFNLPRGEPLRDKWALIPEDTDILITHSPPQGHGDKTFRGDYAGCEDLLRRVEEIKPKYHVFGHIHEGYGVTSGAHTTFVNACICTVEYRPTNKPIVFEITTGD